ncbi:MAG: 6-hydroxymethylpterin diphosphokinase MptE-like protein [Agathobacter sp.]|nr:6-hydroxymethylpterin diphosphokinase MptE-like protein [Agathobacter sp.]
MGFYEENIKYLKEQYNYIKLQENNTEDGINIIEEESVNGRKYLAVESEGYIWRFDSIYQPEYAAKCWCNQFENVNYRTVFIIMGVGNGEQIKALNERYPENIKIICEPTQELFIQLLKHRDIREIFNDKVLLATGRKCSSNFAELIDKIVNYDNKNEIQYSLIPNYHNFNSKKCSEYIGYYKNRIERLVVARNTAILDENTRAFSYLNNILIYPDCSSVGQIINSLQKIDLNGRVAIVVAAGPSLDKNIHLLKQAKNKAFIIGVDTALKSLIAAGVRPDMAIIIDPEKDPNLFEDDIIKNLPLSATMHSNNKILKNHNGRIFFAGGDGEFIKEVSVKYKKSIEVVYSGGSVATNAFSFSALLGFKTIVLVGQDLAYPNGQIHAKDAYTNEEKIDMSEKYFEVEDIFGGKVYTEGNMDAYRRWYEEMIVSNPEYEVIDATEGGAKIHGSKIMTLQEVIDKYLEDIPELNYEEIINNIPQLYTGNEKQELLRYYDSIEAELLKLKEDLESANSNYDAIIDMELNEEQEESVYKECLSKAIELMNDIESNVFLEWSRLYNTYIDYSVLDEMNDSQLLEESESLKAARGGKKICEAYIESLEKVIEEWKCIYNEYNTSNRERKMEYDCY